MGILEAEIESISEIQGVKNYGGKSDRAKGGSLEVQQWRRVYLQRIQRLLASKGNKYLSISEELEQNRVAEHMNQILTERARSIRLWADMSEGFWAEAVNHVNYLINMSLSLTIDLQSSKEI